ncbi:MAG: hypothetical protein VX670_10890, partial [Candidatus Latescibacterota bacterium]|nr:hypothetical protein [Candidatus Latescibacterota bacterium]
MRGLDLGRRAANSWARTQCVHALRGLAGPEQPVLLQQRFLRGAESLRASLPTPPPRPTPVAGGRS